MGAKNLTWHNIYIEPFQKVITLTWSIEKLYDLQMIGTRETYDAQVYSSNKKKVIVLI